MFKRRSSKDLSVRVGYEHLNGKPTKKLDLPRSSASAIAPVANVSAQSIQQNLASSSSSLKTTATTSPQANGEVPTSAGASPLASLKGVIPPAAPASTGSSGGGFPNGDGIKVSARGSSASNGAIAPPKSSAKSSSHSKVTVDPPSKLLMIGEGVFFEGATEGCVAAVVAGKLKGKVKSRRLEVTRAGKVDGTAVCETAEIAGMFEGDLTATKALKICSTGRLRGDVSFGSIVVENGGKLEGRVNFGGLRAVTPQPSSASRSRLDPASAAAVTKEAVSAASDASTASDPPTTPPPTRKSTTDPPPRPSTSATITDERVQERTSIAQEEPTKQDEIPPEQETSPANEEPSPADQEPSPAQDDGPSPAHGDGPSPAQNDGSCPAQEETPTSNEVSPEPKATSVVASTSPKVQEEPIASETSLSEPLQSPK